MGVTLHHQAIEDLLQEGILILILKDIHMDIIEEMKWKKKPHHSRLRGMEMKCPRHFVLLTWYNYSQERHILMWHGPSG